MAVKAELPGCANISRSMPLKRALPVVLALALGLHWWLMVGPGQVDVTTSDWPRQVAYFGLLEEAATTGRLPLVASAPVFDLGPWLWANLEFPLGPHHVLFALWGPAAAIGLTAIFMALVGVAGCLRLARRFDLSPPATALLTVALGLNGVITSHVAAGHLGWLSALLFPWVLEALLDTDAAEPHVNRRGALRLGAVIGVLLLTGAVHIAVEAGLLALLVGLTRPGSRRAVVLGLATGIGLSMWRLLPAAFAFAQSSRPWLADGFRSGWMLLEGLGAVRSPLTTVDVGTTLIGGGRETLALHWFEFDAYLGGALLLLVAAFVPRWPGLAADHDEALVTLRRFEWPIAIAAALTIGRVYAAFVPAPYSLLSVVRVPSRFLLPALCAAVFVAIVRADRWRRAQHTGPYAELLAWSTVAAASCALIYHSVAVSPGYVTYPVTIPAFDGHLAPLPDARMLALHTAGLAISATTALWMWRSR